MPVMQSRDEWLERRRVEDMSDTERRDLGSPRRPAAPSPPPPHHRLSALNAQHDEQAHKSPSCEEFALFNMNRAFACPV